MQSKFVSSLFALPLLASFAAGQGSGLTNGQLVLFDPALNGSSSLDGGIAIVDPLSGAFTKPYSFFATPQRQDGICYDPFRDALIFVAFETIDDNRELLAGDAFGNATPLGISGLNCQAFAPTGDGRIYLRVEAAPSNGIRILDAQNQVSLLEDGNGAPFTIPNNNAWGHMEYDAGTNSLILAHQGVVAPCGITSAVTVRRYDLSPDGKDVVGESCVQFDVDPGLAQSVVGLSRISSNSLLMTVDTNSSEAKPRMLRVQVDPLQIDAWAVNDYFGAAATNAGAYSSLRSSAVIYDTSSDILRAFNFGAVGEGLVVTNQGPIGLSGGTGQVASLIEITDAPTPKLVSLGQNLISVTAGGFQILELDLGPGNAGNLYWMLGSATGTSPGVPLGVGVLPLVFDAYTNFLIVNPNSSPLPNSLGALDASGRATPNVVASAPLPAALVGSSLWHAAIILNGSFQLVDVTTSVPVNFVP
ncbi:MAG: hypothetical protein AAFZ65_13090 [Planctomycetota bacterium]